MRWRKRCTRTRGSTRCHAIRDFDNHSHAQRYVFVGQVPATAAHSAHPNREVAPPAQVSKSKWQPSKCEPPDFKIRWPSLQSCGPCARRSPRRRHSELLLDCRRGRHGPRQHNCAQCDSRYGRSFRPQQWRNGDCDSRSRRRYGQRRSASHRLRRHHQAGVIPEQAFFSNLSSPGARSRFCRRRPEAVPLLRRPLPHRATFSSWGRRRSSGRGSA